MKARRGGKGTFGEIPKFNIAPTLSQERSFDGSAACVEDSFAWAIPLLQCSVSWTNHNCHSGRLPYSARYLSNSSRNSFQPDSQNHSQRVGKSSKINRTANRLSKGHDSRPEGTHKTPAFGDSRAEYLHIDKGLTGTSRVRCGGASRTIRGHQ